MLNRIQKIQNIGRFRQATCGDLQFEKITLIFGRNSYGKSTLGDLHKTGTESLFLDSLIIIYRSSLIRIIKRFEYY